MLQVKLCPSTKLCSIYLAVTRGSNLSLYLDTLSCCRPSIRIGCRLLLTGSRFFTPVENQGPPCFSAHFFSSSSSPRALLKATSDCTTLMDASGSTLLIPQPIAPSPRASSHLPPGDEEPAQAGLAQAPPTRQVRGRQV